MPKAYNYKDPLMFKARKEGFRARSVYKLQELDGEFNLLQPNMHVLDVGAAPGSWLQYTSTKIVPGGQALGIDVKPISAIAENVVTKVADILDYPTIQKLLVELGWQKADIILSDIAPNTSGIKYLDQKRSVELNNAIFEVAKRFLKTGGKLVMKVFPGEDFDPFLKQLHTYFKHVHVSKVSASRDRSREVYVICW